MFLWPIIEWGLVVIVATFVITQLILPAILNKPIFPLFRRSTRKLEAVVDELREERVCEAVSDVRSEVEKLRKKRQKAEIQREKPSETTKSKKKATDSKCKEKGE